MQGLLVVLHGQEVIDLRVDDALRDTLIASHGIDGDESAFKVDAFW
jgi:hypothetical protein